VLIAHGHRILGASHREIPQIGAQILADGVIILILSQRIAGSILAIQHAIMPVATGD
jgi:hypothetical protein